MLCSISYYILFVYMYSILFYSIHFKREGLLYYVGEKEATRKESVGEVRLKNKEEVFFMCRHF